MQRTRLSVTVPWSLCALLVLLGSLLCLRVDAYIPASPTNETSMPMNSSTPSHLKLQWYSGGYTENVSYQLVGADSDGISKVRSQWRLDVCDFAKGAVDHRARSCTFLNSSFPMTAVSVPVMLCDFSVCYVRVAFRICVKVCRILTICCELGLYMILGTTKTDHAAGALLGGLLL